MEDDVVLGEPEPVVRHRLAADHHAVAVQHALGLGGRAGGEDEIGRVVGRGRRVVRRLALRGEPSDIVPVEDAHGGKQRPLLRVGVAKHDRRGAGIGGERQRLLGRQHQRGRLSDAADRGGGEDGDHGLDVVGGPDHHPVALSESVREKAAGEAADFGVELGVGPGAQGVGVVGDDQRGLPPALDRLPAKAMPGEVEDWGAGRHGKGPEDQPELLPMRPPPLKPF